VVVCVRIPWIDALGIKRESVLSHEFTAGVQRENMHGWAVPWLLVSYSSLFDFVIELKNLHFLSSFNIP
jgi:hypothetical protein